ncbi:MAG: sodium:proton antiporter [Desulfurococcus sp.]|uniref:sodium:proton antiporter n=1 Tax=Desulfurococcus sp. TaxID=51678 RepID=UPI003D0CB2C2
MIIEVVMDPSITALIILAGSGLTLLVAATLYYLLKSRSVRTTELYLSGEGENVVSNLSPGVGSLYYGFMKRFAKNLYRVLAESVHTGSLHDWFNFIASWLGLLVLIAILVLILMLTGW